MIKIRFVYELDFLHEFNIKGHAPKYICSAVSMLVINTINSIEKFTDSRFFCDYDKNGGRFYFKFKNKFVSREAKVLIRALDLGLRSISSEYKNHVIVSEVRL